MTDDLRVLVERVNKVREGIIFSVKSRGTVGEPTVSPMQYVRDCDVLLTALEAAEDELRQTKTSSRRGGPGGESVTTTTQAELSLSEKPSVSLIQCVWDCSVIFSCLEAAGMWMQEARAVFRELAGEGPMIRRIESLLARLEPKGREEQPNE